MSGLLPFVGLIIIVFFFAFMTKGQSIALSNIKTVVEQSIIQMIASVGVFFVMTMGMMDLSIGGAICICCYVIAKIGQVNIPLGIVAGIVTGIFVGYFNGFITAKLKAPSFLATLCTLYIISGLMTQLIASEAVTVPFALYAFDEFYYKFPLLLLILAVGYFLFRYTKYGHYLRMIGSQELAATFTGINVAKIKIWTYGICGFLAAIAAFLSAIRSGTASLSTGSSMMFNAMISLTLGGFPMGGGARAKFLSPILGSLILQTLNNGLVILGVSSTAQQVIRGIIFLVIITVTSESEKLKYLFVGSNKVFQKSEN